MIMIDVSNNPSGQTMTARAAADGNIMRRKDGVWRPNYWRRERRTAIRQRETHVVEVDNAATTTDNAATSAVTHHRTGSKANGNHHTIAKINNMAPGHYKDRGISLGTHSRASR